MHVCIVLCYLWRVQELKLWVTYNLHAIKIIVKPIELNQRCLPPVYTQITQKKVPVLT